MKSLFPIGTRVTLNGRPGTVYQARVVNLNRRDTICTLVVEFDDNTKVSCSEKELRYHKNKFIPGVCSFNDMMKYLGEHNEHLSSRS